jgi:Na+/H+ antiporter NhaD/arsenite permease-like protein
VAIFGIPLEFFLFAAVLLGIAVWHRRALTVTLGGLSVILAYKFATGFTEGVGFAGFTAFVAHEWVILAELLLLLTGFAILSNQFERSCAPDALPRLLPDDWTGGLALLAVVFVMSAFLDNIAAAVIGGVMAKHLYGGRVSIGFLAALVASANAGGAGSVLGDTTTTLMWIGGVPPLTVMPAFVGAVAAFAVFGVFGALQQQRHQPIQKHMAPTIRVRWLRLVLVALMLLSILGANLFSNLYAPQLHHLMPVLGVALWAAILLTSLVRQPDWKVLPDATKGAVFLVALVACAALMPVENLPAPSWQTALGLGFLSAVFDNIPLTALALKQDGYDWAILAYAVGFGGSMIWFGSSAGVALSNSYPEARSVLAWLRQGWFVPVAFVVGFFAMLATIGWRDLPALPAAEAGVAAVAADH